MRPKRSSAEAQLGLPEYLGHSLVEKVAFAMLVLLDIVLSMLKQRSESIVPAQASDHSG